MHVAEIHRNDRAGAAIGAIMPYVLGILQDRGITLVTAMTVSMMISAAFAATALWLGPETRGRRFDVD